MSSGRHRIARSSYSHSNITPDRTSASPPPCPFAERSLLPAAMKLSLKFPDRRERRTCPLAGDDGHSCRPQHHPQQPVLKAKVPISVLSQPLATSVTATAAAPSDLSVSLSTNFPSGPSLKVSYFPNAAPSSSALASPFSVTLKSGLGLFGSPKDSPLTFSAHFSLSRTTLCRPTPIFSLQFKPRVGHFSFSSSASSNHNPTQVSKFQPPFASDSAIRGGFPRTVASDSFQPGENAGLGIGFKPAEVPATWEDLKLESCGVKDKVSMEPCPVRSLNFAENYKNRGDVFSGVSFRAKTALPITKCLRLNFHWGVNLPSENDSFIMPHLMVQKVGIERDEEVKNVKAEAERGSDFRVGDTELMKGLCLWMRRDLEVMQRENAEMKQYLEEMRPGVGKRVSASPKPSEKKPDFETWRNQRKSGDENGTGSGQSANRLLDVESELRKAIKSSAT